MSRAGAAVRGTAAVQRDESGDGIRLRPRPPRRARRRPRRYLGGD